MTPVDFAPALAALDDLLAAEMRRLRARYALSLDEFRGLYVSDEMADALLAGSGVEPPSRGPRISAALISPLADARARLGLCPMGCAVLLLALAPELDTKYPPLLAYLNDDVNRRWPSLNLAQRLFTQTGDASALQRLRAILSPGLPAADGGLVSSGVLLPASAEENTLPIPLRGWRAAPAFTHHMLALPGFAAPDLARLPTQPAGAPIILRENIAPVLLVTGEPGVGRRREAGAWAARLGMGALLLAAPGPDPPDAETLAQAQLTASLNGALLTLDLTRCVPAPLRGLDPRAPLAVIAASASGWSSALAPRIVLGRQCAAPDATQRRDLWLAALSAHELEIGEDAVAAVADRFHLSEASIRRAARRLTLETSSAKLDDAGLAAAARIESAAEMGPLARPVTTRANWGDLVLPDGALMQLKDFASAIAMRGRVFESWGFGAVGRGGGGGLVALFSGSSGTGKTMSAAVIAAQLGLDMWRIDLAATVSKYIGETEKNLERLFCAAGASNAILFFDEADALFGKRSEVKDSHDRYANIEIAYLLQRLEDHPGVVILASNLSRNLDTAFLRRLPFVIEFPMPDAAGRAKLWRKAIPETAPLSPQVNFDDLAQRFDLSGGDIRTAALEAAFLAAGRDEVIDAAALDLAIRRQLMKRGQLPAPAAAKRANGHAVNGVARELPR